MLAQLRLERLVAAPPGLTSDIKAILAGAFAKALADPQAVKLARNIDIELAPSTPEQVTARIRESADFFNRWKKYFVA